MSAPIIRVEGLGKKYTLHHKNAIRGAAPYKRFSDVFSIAGQKSARFFKEIFSRSKTQETSTTEEFWALKDISFEINKGDAVGIVGRNGAGKSTLLKLLSRITEPSTGRIELRGRVASLLEVGTGFHHELTGRENIFLNGAILGMSRAEVKSKFDEIVAFSEMEKFLDTPVKRYSSGMYMRLAFAVAAHLEPDILIVDEVLAVGDLEFQKKCLGKMEDVTKTGRTVLFVSHNMDMVAKLCEKGLILNAGRAGEIESVQDAISRYMNFSAGNGAQFEAADSSKPLRSASIDTAALLEEDLIITINHQFPDHVCTPALGFVLYNEMGAPIFGSHTVYQPPKNRIEKSGSTTVTIPKIPIWSGHYYLSLWLTDCWTPVDHVEKAISFDFVSTTAPVNAPPPKLTGPIYLPAEWHAR